MPVNPLKAHEQAQRVRVLSFDLVVERVRHKHRPATPYEVAALLLIPPCRARDFDHLGFRQRLFTIDVAGAYHV
jgi:hypothetical protein